MSVSGISSPYHYLIENVCTGDCLNVIFYKKGETIYGPGQPFPGVCEILSGTVRTSNLTEEGEEATSEILTRTDMFGNLKSLPDNPSEVATALVDSEICVYQTDELARVVAENPLLSDWYTHYLMQRWSSLERRLLRINTCKTIDNVARLHQTFNRKIQDANGREQVLLRLVTQKDLADLTGVTRQTVAAAMKELEKRANGY